MKIEKNWWEKPGLPRPCYVGISRRKTRGLAALALTLVALIIAELLQYIPYGTTILVAFIVGLIQFLAAFLGHPNIKKSDEMLLTSILSLTKDFMSRYSIPSMKIPLAVQYINGVQLYAAYTTGRLNIYIVKPKTYHKIMMNKKPLFKYKFIRRYRLKNLVFGEASLTAPHIELRNTVVNTRALMVKFLPHRELSIIVEWIREFDRKYSEAISRAIHTSNRRRPHTRQGGKNT
ncbi:MAG: hypothetical protein GXO43_09280 [Crenarchaeota archaeon]|nr:hypothetical protein [Thermoproteota archaeon]